MQVAIPPLLLPWVRKTYFIFIFLVRRHIFYLKSVSVRWIFYKRYTFFFWKWDAFFTYMKYNWASLNGNFNEKWPNTPFIDFFWNNEWYIQRIIYQSGAVYRLQWVLFTHANFLCIHILCIHIHTFLHRDIFCHIFHRFWIDLAFIYQRSIWQWIAKLNGDKLKLNLYLHMLLCVHTTKPIFTYTYVYTQYTYSIHTVKSVFPCVSICSHGQIYIYIFPYYTLVKSIFTCVSVCIC